MIESQEGFMAALAAVGTFIGAVAGAYGMKRHTEADREALGNEVAALTEKIIRLEERVHSLVDDRERDRIARNKVLDRLEALGLQIARIESLCSIKHTKAQAGE